MPWVPRDLYELMLDALRQTRASVASPVVPENAGVAGSLPALAPSQPSDAQRGSVDATASEVTPLIVSEGAPELPRMVTDAVAMYAFGDPIEAAANYSRAVALHKAGRPAAEIVREIRQGANPEAFI